MTRSYQDSLCTVTLVAGLLATGCLDDLKPDDGGDAGSRDSGTPTEVDGTVNTTTLDASDQDAWVYFDLDSGEELDSAGDGWDLALRRFKIKSNGGVSGDGGVAIAVLEGADFDALEKAPEAGYLEDRDDGDDENSDEDFVFLVGDGWYDYDGSDHTLSARDIVYVVRSTASRFYKVQVLDYYDGAGTSGFVKFRWAEIDAPGDDIQVGASEAGAGEADAGAPPDGEGEDYGCYDMESHTCDCAVEESACSGIWTDSCSCDEQTDADSGADAETDVARDAGAVGDSGCYDPMTHQCDCELDAPACTSAGRVWTDACGCGAESEQDGGGDQVDAGGDANAGGADASSGDASSDDSGCYDLMTHQCDCETDEPTCTAAGRIWTDGCGC